MQGADRWRRHRQHPPSFTLTDTCYRWRFHLGRHHARSSKHVLSGNSLILLSVPPGTCRPMSLSMGEKTLMPDSYAAVPSDRECERATFPMHSISGTAYDPVFFFCLRRLCIIGLRMLKKRIDDPPPPPKIKEKGLLSIIASGRRKELMVSTKPFSPKEWMEHSRETERER